MRAVQHAILVSAHGEPHLGPPSDQGKHHALVIAIRDHEEDAGHADLSTDMSGYHFMYLNVTSMGEVTACIPYSDDEVSRAINDYHNEEQ